MSLGMGPKPLSFCVQIHGSTDFRAPIRRHCFGVFAERAIRFHLAGGLTSNNQRRKYYVSPTPLPNRITFFFFCVCVLQKFNVMRFARIAFRAQSYFRFFSTYNKK